MRFFFLSDFLPAFSSPQITHHVMIIKLYPAFHVLIITFKPLFDEKAFCLQGSNEANHKIIAFIALFKIYRLVACQVLCYSAH